MKKFSWGHGIVIFLALFFISIIVRVFISLQYEVDLITADYYPKALDYQSQINRTINAGKLAEPAKATIQGNELVVLFPKEQSSQNISAKYWFYCPSDMKADLIIENDLVKNGEQTISLTPLKKTKYILKLTWKTDSLEFYQEIEINLNQ